MFFQMNWDCRACSLRLPVQEKYTLNFKLRRRQREITLPYFPRKRGNLQMVNNRKLWSVMIACSLKGNNILKIVLPMSSAWLCHIFFRTHTHTHIRRCTATHIQRQRSMYDHTRALTPTDAQIKVAFNPFRRASIKAYPQFKIVAKL